MADVLFVPTTWFMTVGKGAGVRVERCVRVLTVSVSAKTTKSLTLEATALLVATIRSSPMASASAGKAMLSTHVESVSSPALPHTSPSKVDAPSVLPILSTVHKSTAASVLLAPIKTTSALALRSTSNLYPAPKDSTSTNNRAVPSVQVLAELAPQLPSALHVPLLVTLPTPKAGAFLFVETD